MKSTSTMKRQRAGIACDKCRLLKAKCDARQPVCSRCEGYGFNCSWSTRRRRAPSDGLADAGHQLDENSFSHSLDGRTVAPGKRDSPAYSRAVQSYEALIKELRLNLDSSQQAALDLSLQNIQRHLREATKDEYPPTPSTATITQENNAAESSPTYVGKASDIHFIHSIRQCVHGNSPPDEDAPTRSYSQYHGLESFAALTHPLLVPSQAETSQLLDVYLSTIHIAYPFIYKQALLDEFQHFRAGDYNRPGFQPWRALFNFIFAIGSYYTSFPQAKHSGSHQHVRYFEQGLYFSRELGADCSLLNVWVLLVQCFYLLAVSHTDRCWNTLGFAIRMGQSIGLHVELSLNSSHAEPSWMRDRAHWRRTWYSMYVLDRLLALQLGRPMAIHEADFQVELPSVTDEAPFGHISDEAPAESRRPPCRYMMDYFFEVIRFSQILGSVIRELYRPTQIDLSPDQMLQSTSDLDQRLLEWKTNLPRHLRFDLGHTFEKSISFKRQRNMLAVKFHHLRALIHRPFLCLPFLQMNNPLFMELLVQDQQRISQAEWTSIHEAQETAHLLHNVTDERSLVHDFPWWQMIPCLICASSILFVAETFYSHNSFLEGKTSAQSLREDAETCLKVFEALSVNSVAAQKAADMLAGLSQMRRATDESATLENSAVPGQQHVYSPSGGPPAHAGLSGTSGPASYLSSPRLSADMAFPYEWPSEISSAMEWSVQFMDYPQFQMPDLSIDTYSSHK